MENSTIPRTIYNSELTEPTKDILFLTFPGTSQNSDTIIHTVDNIPDGSLNNITDTGAYIVDKIASAVTDAPDTGSYFSGLLLVVSVPSKLVQMFIDDNNIYYRRKFFDKWIAWSNFK